jgi:hypothetical protein
MSSETQSSPSGRMKWMIAGAGIVAVIVVVIGAVLLSGDEEESEPTLTPEPTATDTPEPTATDTPEPTPTNTPEPTATEEPTAEPTVTDTPEPTPDPGIVTITLGETCSLADAINASNSGNTAAGCPRGGSKQTIIEFTADVVVGRGTAPGTLLLPRISRPLVIEGNGYALIADPDRAGRHMVITPEVEVTLRNLTIAGGRGDGTAIQNEGRLTVDGCTFYDNVSGGEGGAIHNRNWLQITNSTFRDNSAAKGGGAIFNRFVPQFADGGLFISNSTFFNNDSGNGAQIYVQYEIEAPVEIVNSTITAAANGAGIAINAGGPLLVNTIIAYNEGGDCELLTEDAAFTGDHNLSDDPDCPGAESPSGLADTLDDHGGPTETLALLEGSSAIDAGSADACPATDQRGAPRDDGACDIGAVEFGSVPPDAD